MTLLLFLSLHADSKDLPHFQLSVQHQQVSHAQVKKTWMFLISFFISLCCFIVHTLPPRSLAAAVKWFCLVCDSRVSAEIVSKLLAVRLPSLERD